MTSRKKCCDKNRKRLKTGSCSPPFYVALYYTIRTRERDILIHLLKVGVKQTDSSFRFWIFWQVFVVCKCSKVELKSFSKAERCAKSISALSFQVENASLMEPHRTKAFRKNRERE